MNKFEEYKSKMKYDLWLDVTKVNNEKEKAATTRRLRSEWIEFKTISIDCMNEKIIIIK